MFDSVTSGWSHDDKKKLLMALRKHGCSNILEIHKELPYKSISELRNMFDKLSRQAYTKWVRLEKNSEDDPPVKKWVNLLKKSNSKHRGGLNDIIPRVLKYIALYEKKETSSLNDINLNDCYLVLSDISSGLASKDLNCKTNYFFYECLTKLALSLKEEDTAKYTEHLQSLRNFEQMTKKNNEDETELSEVLNPLNFPKELLELTPNDESSSSIDVFKHIPKSNREHGG